jgi:hypothetical protein
MREFRLPIYFRRELCSVIRLDFSIKFGESARRAGLLTGGEI